MPRARQQIAEGLVFVSWFRVCSKIITSVIDDTPQFFHIHNLPSLSEVTQTYAAINNTGVAQDCYNSTGNHDHDPVSLSLHCLGHFSGFGSALNYNVHRWLWFLCYAASVVPTQLSLQTLQYTCSKLVYTVFDANNEQGFTCLSTVSVSTGWNKVRSVDFKSLCFCVLVCTLLLCEHKRQQTAALQSYGISRLPFLYHFMIQPGGICFSSNS